MECSGTTVKLKSYAWSFSIQNLKYKILQAFSYLDKSLIRYFHQSNHAYNTNNFIINSKQATFNKSAHLLRLSVYTQNKNENSGV